MPNAHTCLKADDMPGQTSGGDHGAIDDAVRDYIDAIAPEHRPLFDRLHRLILEVRPDVAVVLSYQIPTYKVEGRRLDG